MSSIKISVSIDQHTEKPRVQISESLIGQISGSDKHDFYVYEWYVISTGEIFYIGKGRGNRYREYHTHAYDAERIRSTYETGVMFVGTGLTEEEAVELETQEMFRILNETSHRLTNRIVPITAKRGNGYGPSPSVPPLQFETTPWLFATEIDEHYFGIKPRQFDPVDLRNIRKVHYIDKSLSYHDSKALYKGNPDKYRNVVSSWLLSKGITSVKTKYAKSVSAWIYTDDEDVHNYNIDQKLALERLGRTIPVFRLLDLWKLAKQSKR